MSEIPDRDALYLQCAAFAGGEPDGSFLEIRPLKPTGTQRWVPVGELRGAAAVALSLAAEHEVFIGANPRTSRTGTAEHVQRTWCLLADCDTPESVKRLRVFKPQPPLVLITSPGHVHAYWPLREPLANEPARAAKRTLARALAADMQCADPARVMRAIGTVNRKHGEPVKARCVRCDLDVFTAAEVIGHLPAETPRTPRTPPRSVTPDALDRIAPAEYVELLGGHEIGRDGKTLCPFHEERTPSLHVYDTPERGWVCFGCGRGGSIIDFGAALYDLPTRGAGYLEIRRKLACDLVRGAAA